MVISGKANSSFHENIPELDPNKKDKPQGDLSFFVT